MKKDLITKKQAKKEAIRSIVTVVVLWGFFIGAFRVINDKATDKALHPGFDEMTSPMINMDVYNATMNEKGEDISVKYSRGTIYSIFMENYIDQFDETMLVLSKMTFEKDITNVDDANNEIQFLQEKLGDKYSSKIKPFKQEDYWIASSYNLDNMTVTYDIVLYKSDFDIANPNVQEVLKYFQLDACYNKQYNCFDESILFDKIDNYHSFYNGCFDITEETFPTEN